MKKWVDVQAKAVGDEGEVIMSTDGLDSQNDRVMQSGLQFRSPLPVLFAHDYRSLPVAVTREIIRSPNQTRAKFRWIENDEQAARVRNVFQVGGLGASIGFTITRATRNREGGQDIHEAHVSEVSLVPIPANRDCVALLKSLYGTMGDAVIDMQDGTFLPLPVFAEAVKDASTVAMVSAARGLVRSALHEALTGEDDPDDELVQARALGRSLARQLAPEILPHVVREALADYRLRRYGILD